MRNGWHLCSCPTVYLARSVSMDSWDLPWEIGVPCINQENKSYGGQNWCNPGNRKKLTGVKNHLSWRPGRVKFQSGQAYLFIQIRKYNARLYFNECPVLFGNRTCKNLGVLVWRKSEHFKIFLPLAYFRRPILGPALELCGTGTSEYTQIYIPLEH